MILIEMGSSFNGWEKDPFFSAADEVQESADRFGFPFSVCAIFLFPFPSFVWLWGKENLHNLERLEIISDWIFALQWQT